MGIIAVMFPHFTLYVYLKLTPGRVVVAKVTASGDVKK